ncbi:class I adenylate-forming enzyme family protein [Polynucleobacter sphagniphilus]|uniref:class I adenylate-forming enzyme family protein n=1 Tax=Polynucleobacter sphagniphilus TaxID=1743169 RepID=UPI002476E84D|nr:class I adenylate-forming enzyme family protein [Polynucleobacter sphagniphilus]
MDQSKSGSAAILYWAKTQPKVFAFDSGDTKYTYYQMAIHIAKYTKALKLIGLKRGDIIGIETEHIYLHFVLNLAVEVIGATHVALSNVDFENSQDILDACNFYIVQNIKDGRLSETKKVLIADQFIKLVSDLKINNEEILCLDHPSYLNDVVYLSGTSGTTGVKKYSENTRLAICAETDLFISLFFKKLKKINFIMTYNLRVGASYAGGVAALNVGSTIVLSYLSLLNQTIEAYPNSHLALTVRDADYLNKHCIYKSVKKLSSVRVLGANLPLVLRSWLENYLAEHVVNSYSSNEAGQIAEVRADGIGYLYPNVAVEVVNENNERLPNGEVGKFTIKSPQLVSGYLWDAQLTKKYFYDGWFLTSDSGYKLTKNKLKILGRTDELLNLGGVKVAPNQYEEKIKRIDGVLDCALVSPFENPQGKIYVCIERDLSGIDEIILKLTSEILCSYANQIKLFFFKIFPRTYSGKVQRGKLLEQINFQEML